MHTKETLVHRCSGPVLLIESKGVGPSGARVGCVRAVAI